MQKEMTKAGVIEEMMDDVMDQEDEELDEEADEEIDKVLEEITMKQMDGAGSVPLAQLPAEQQAQAEGGGQGASS